MEMSSRSCPAAISTSKAQECEDTQSQYVSYGMLRERVPYQIEQALVPGGDIQKVAIANVGFRTNQAELLPEHTSHCLHLLAMECETAEIHEGTDMSFAEGVFENVCLRIAQFTQIWRLRKDIPLIKKVMR